MDKGAKAVIRGFLIVLGVAYLCLAGYAYFYSDQIIYQPPRATYTTSLDGYCAIHTPEGQDLAAVWLSNRDAQFTILYFHGNGCDIGQERPFLEELRKHGFSVLAYDFRGYGLSGGHPSEKALFRDARYLLTWLKEQKGVPAERVIAYGRSLGGGSAVEMAANERLAGLMLESTFTSAFRVMIPWRVLPFDRFNNLGKLARIHCPVLVMHGTWDNVIPFEQSEALFRAANEPKYFLRVDGAGHYAVPQVAGERYWTAVRNFTAKL
jgi:fermentation-respiration switch protein FrsA (DUF1100 family)